MQFTQARSRATFRDSAVAPRPRVCYQTPGEFTLNATNPTPEEAPAPESDVRLLCWFGIYCAGSLPALLRTGAWFDPINWLMAPLLFATGLSTPFVAIMNAIYRGDPGEMLVIPAACGYIPYGIHMHFTALARTRRRFSLLLLMLVVLVLLTQRLLGPFFINPISG